MGVLVEPGPRDVAAEAYAPRRAREGSVEAPLADRRQAEALDDLVEVVGVDREGLGDRDRALGRDAVLGGEGARPRDDLGLADLVLGQRGAEPAAIEGNRGDEPQ